jgi:hypothetical protein
MPHSFATMVAPARSTSQRPLCAFYVEARLVIRCREEFAHRIPVDRPTDQSAGDVIQANPEACDCPELLERLPPFIDAEKLRSSLRDQPWSWESFRAAANGRDDAFPTVSLSS